MAALQFVYNVQAAFEVRKKQPAKHFAILHSRVK